MTTVTITQKSGPDKVLHLAVPVSEPDRSYQVTVLVEKADDEPGQSWPDKFFEETAGKWQGDLERAPQGEPETREEF